MVLTFLQSNKLSISIFLIWLFHVSALVGISMGHGAWFLPLTPLNLTLCFGLIIWNIPNVRSTDLLLLIIPFSFGMIAEWLGVNYGLIFGDYSYGNNLGPKIWGVPWMIGVNWAILVYITMNIARKFSKNLWLNALIGSGLMVLLDFIIEIIAPNIDFWEFNGHVAPVQNYIGWFVVGFFAHLLFQRFFKQTLSFWFEFNLFLVFVLFFGFLIWII
jgi:putative membrane protein